MDILGIGPMELLLILIVALMVFGPDRLPTIGSKLGRAMRDMRRATRAISEEINATRAAIEAPAKELTEPFGEVADAAKSISGIAAAARNPGEAIRKSVLKELNTPASTEQTPASTEQTAASTEQTPASDGQSPAPPPEPDNTIAPPDLAQEVVSGTDAAPLPAEEVPEPPGAAPTGAPDLPDAIDPQTASDMQTPTDPHPASDAGPDAINTGDAPEQEPQEMLQPGEQGAPPQSTDDLPAVTEP